MSVIFEFIGASIWVGQQLTLRAAGVGLGDAAKAVCLVKYATAASTAV